MQALALALLPAAGNFAGGAVAEIVPISKRTLSIALHVAAGIVLAVVGLELMTEALKAGAPYQTCIAFVAGAGFAMALGHVVGHIRERFSKGGTSAGPWMIYVGVAVDLFSDGVMIGTGSTISFQLALLLALGQVAGDLPEGVAMIASFRNAGVKRSKRLLLAASFAIPILLGTLVSFLGLRGRAEIWQLTLLAFTAGILLTVAVDEMVTQAHEAWSDEDTGGASNSLALAAGFALFALLSQLFES